MDHSNHSSPFSETIFQAGAEEVPGRERKGKPVVSICITSALISISSALGRTQSESISVQRSSDSSPGVCQMGPRAAVFSVRFIQIEINSINPTSASVYTYQVSRTET